MDRSEGGQHGDVWVTEEDNQFITLGITAEREYVAFLKKTLVQ